MFPHINTDFPEGDEYWMVVWVYLITLKEDDYYFTVDLAEVKNLQVLTKPKPYHAGNYTNKRRTVTVGHAFLNLMEIGSVWYRQRLVFSPALSAHPGSVLTVSITDPQQADSIALHTLAHRLDGFGQLHPFSNLTHPPLASSPCHVLGADIVTVRDGERISMLLLPPSELLRFYHCGSANLLKQVLSNGIAREQIYLHGATRYDSATHELSIRMRGHLRDSDAHFVGRLAGDEIAHRAVTEFGKRVQEQLVNNRVSHLDIGFPFAGPTQLTVTGKWLKILTSPTGWAFLVYTIKSCTAELPYSHLHFYRENDATKTEDPQREVFADQGVVREARPPDEGALISSTAAPSPGLATGELAILTAAKSKFLQAPPATRMLKEQQLVATVGHQPRWYVNLPRYTVAGEGIGPDGVLTGPLNTEVNANESPNEGEGVTFSQFHAITEYLRPAVICSYINHPVLGDGTGNEYSSADYVDFPYPSVSTNPGVRRWLPIQSPREKVTGPRQNRRVVVLQLVYEARVFYLIECEARKTENFSRLLLLTDSVHHDLYFLLSRLLTRLAEHRGIWKGVWKKLNASELRVTKQAIHHGKEDTPARVAALILRYLKKDKL